MPKVQHDHDNLGGSNRMINLAAAAEMLAVPPDRLRKHWKRWGIDAYKVGRELRFRQRDVNAWLAKQRIAS
jgi:excisionase family DNA binding protein